MTLAFNSDNSYYEKFSDGTVKCIEDEIPFELPMGWEWCNLSMIGSTNIGLTYKPTDINNNGTIVLRSTNIVNSKLCLNDIVRVTTNIRDNQYIENNDILICARNGSKALVGKCAIIENCSELLSFGAFMTIFRTKLYKYVFCYFNTKLFRNNFDNDDSKQINQVTQSILKTSLIPIPPQNEQEKIVSIISNFTNIFTDIENYFSV